MFSQVIRLRWMEIHSLSVLTNRRLELWSITVMNQTTRLLLTISWGHASVFQSHARGTRHVNDQRRNWDLIMNKKYLFITFFMALVLTSWGSLHAVNIVFGIDGEQILDSDSPSLTALINNPVTLSGSSGTVGDTLTVSLSGGSVSGVTYSTSSANCSVTSLGAVTATSVWNNSLGHSTRSTLIELVIEGHSTLLLIITLWVTRHEYTIEPQNFPWLANKSLQLHRGKR